eukprot:TRINITY_DN105393_c0_g1_i1.p1 TRINITY_DN105393_c0_g1~~TRINITY_DN105393_c0_g1_i1.p1  ORF type:complete len:327 (-),score=7.49 TRINITY_DN105393_c0_g1_i1:1476-2456(-)
MKCNLIGRQSREKLQWQLRSVARLQHCKLECCYIIQRNYTYKPIFNDGYKTPEENCDDGNNVQGDGQQKCNIILNRCYNGEIEEGWTCTVNASMTSICTPICGDGYTISPETCDPPSGMVLVKPQYRGMQFNLPSYERLLCGVHDFRQREKPVERYRQAFFLSSIECDISCLDCTGSGPENCIECAVNYTMNGSVCIVNTTVESTNVTDDNPATNTTVDPIDNTEENTTAPETNSTVEPVNTTEESPTENNTVDPLNITQENPAENNTVNPLNINEENPTENNTVEPIYENNTNSTNETLNDTVYETEVNSTTSTETYSKVKYGQK